MRHVIDVSVKRHAPGASSERDRSRGGTMR